MASPTEPAAHPATAGSESAFESLNRALRTGGSQAAFDVLARRFLQEKDYPRVFELRLMKKRHELGLPLILTQPLQGLPPKVQQEYDEASIEAAREVGGLFLRDGNIVRAWPYFRAIGDPRPVADAVEQVENNDEVDPILEIAFYERVNPRKGFELILERFGTCRAITMFSQFPGVDGRDESAALLVRSVHSDLLANLRRTVATKEGEAPSTDNLSELTSGRSWLFEGNTYYLDTSHVISVIQFSKELQDPEVLELARQMCDYGECLAEMFQHEGEPPFQNVFRDHGVYLRALLGQAADRAIEHFRRKVPSGPPAEVDPRPAETLVRLLVRLKRYRLAAQIARVHLEGVDPSQIQCPTAIELCQMAEDYRQLRELAEHKGDLLSYTAAALQS